MHLMIWESPSDHHFHGVSPVMALPLPHVVSFVNKVSMWAAGLSGFLVQLRKLF